jgi:LPXTG-motif cell wall-anchored protein
MVFNTAGTKLFVADGFAGIREVTFAGTPAVPTAIATLSHSQIPASINSMSQVIHTGGLALDSTGALYFGGRVLDQSMSSLLRVSVFKRTAAGVVTEVVSSDAAAGAPTQKQGSNQFSGPRDIKVVGQDLYVLYENKLIRTDLSGNLEAEYTLTDAVQARSVAILDSTIYVGLTSGGRVVTFPDNAPNATAITPTQTVRFGTAANETFALGNTQASVELTGPRSMMVHNGALYISDMNQQNLFSAIIAIVAIPAVTPVTQTVSGTADTAITDSTAFTATDFTGTVTYAVTSGSLPAGLAISSSTGVISGTPSASSTASVTITATGATAGSATATVTFAIVAAPATTTTTAPATSTTIPATTTTIPATTTAPSGPANVTSSNQATLTQTPGAATALVNGQPVSVAVETPADLPAAQVDPEDRSPAQVQSLQVAADNLVDQLNQAAGGNSGLAVQDTPTGAAITGLLTTPVPIENTVLVVAANKSTLFAALNEDGSVTEVQPGAVIEVLGNGQVGVVASGLTPGESVEFVIMSTPTLLGTYTVASNGTIKAQTSLPDGIGLGNHTLVVASPTVQASLGLKVSAPQTTLPTTGSSSDNTTQIALFLMVGGLMVAFLRRRSHILN